MKIKAFLIILFLLSCIGHSMAFYSQPSTTVEGIKIQQQLLSCYQHSWITENTSPLLIDVVAIEIEEEDKDYSETVKKHLKKVVQILWYLQLKDNQVNHTGYAYFKKTAIAPSSKPLFLVLNDFRI